MAFDASEDDASEAVASLHKTLVVLREELIAKNRRIKELEDLLNNMSTKDGVLSASRSRCCSHGDLSDPQKTLKTWNSEPILSSANKSFRKTKITVKLKVPIVPNTQYHRHYSPTYSSDLRVLQSVIEENKEPFCVNSMDSSLLNAEDESNLTNSDESVDDLIQEARDFLDVASNRLVTIRDWNKIKEKKKKRKSCPSPSMLEDQGGSEDGSPFVPQKMQDLKLGDKVRLLLSGEVLEGVVKNLNNSLQSVRVKVFHKENNINPTEEFDVLLKRIILSWH